MICVDNSNIDDNQNTEDTWIDSFHETHITKQ